MLYVIIGSLLYEDWPIQSMLILFINFTVDYFGCIILASELPPGDNGLLKKKYCQKQKGKPRIFESRMVY
jgi:hypothetical protein